MRLKVPDEGATVVDDVIRGEAVFQHVHMDDPVIARADGSVLYNFAVAVDDLDAGITHVVRGEDHLSNTPKQLLVFEALGETPPKYAHLPLLHGPDGKKLSKRHGAASVQELRDEGYLPEAVRNYLALLGWGFDDETTFFSTEELQKNFSLERVSKSPAVFDTSKLRWMNGHYLREMDVDELTRRLEERTGRTGLRQAVELAREKIQTLDEFWPLVGFLFDGPADDPDAWAKTIGTPEGAAALAEAREALAATEPFEVPEIEVALRSRGRAPGRQAEPGLPARSGRNCRENGLSRHLRKPRCAGQNGGSGAYRRGAPEKQRWLAGFRCGRLGLNHSSRNADTGGRGPVPGAHDHLPRPRTPLHVSCHCSSAHGWGRFRPAASQRGPRPPAHRRVRGARRVSGAR